MGTLFGLFGIYVIVFLFTLFCLIPVYFIIKWATKKAIRETLQDRFLMEEFTKLINGGLTYESKYNSSQQQSKNNVFTLKD
ncbi:MAG TPA: hypothetical protein VFH18_02955 [Erysipelotrichaceae bacterium]|nr:hypothetical protein [Erysipelotrichaceae bacterium]